MPAEGPNLFTLLGIGVTSAVCVAVGMGLGWLLDGRLHTFPLFVLVGLALGVLAACAYVYVEIRKFLKNSS
ncbi:MAG TPA: AtpZ/AtpI family protein [Mycobacteriales bacterium]|nr:AtpZ/AtpI family protein [Mycobacteriales bacterium]